MTADWATQIIDEARDTEIFENDDLISGQAWLAFCDALRGAGDRILRDDVANTPLNRAAGFRHLMGLLHIGVDHAMGGTDPWRPMLKRSRSDIFKASLDCPDAVYQSTAIRGDLNYRVWGDLGTVRYLSFQINGPGGNVGNMRGDQLQVAADGTFELWIGPQPHEGNWLSTPPEADGLFIRQFFYDWDAERAATLQIERVAGEESPPVADPNFPTPDRVARQLEAVGRWINACARHRTDVGIQTQQAARNGFLPAFADPQAGGAVENIVGRGNFDLAGDEALIVEVTPVHALYWSLQLGNPWGNSLDYANRQTSLNGRQAVLDDDGIFRAVVAHQDPGVPNWLDTLGHPSGPMMFRWVLSDGAPEPRCTVVSFSALRDVLPPTPTVSPAQRAAVIERRRAHVLRRYAF